MSIPEIGDRVRYQARDGRHYDCKVEKLDPACVYRRCALISGDGRQQVWVPLWAIDIVV